MQFDEIQRRVLGVLIEKSMAQPQYYPMTVNAIVQASNQKNNRDPVMELDDEAVWSALQELQQQHLVLRVLPPPGSRADRFKHDVPGQLGWQSPQRAILTELMLRGPQTVGELRGHCARMHAFASTDEVQAALTALANWDPPLVRAMPREPGRSAIRFDHLLYAEGEQPAEVAATTVPAATSAPAQAAPAVAASPAARPAAGGEIDDLHGEIAELHEALAALERRVAALEQR